MRISLVNTYIDKYVKVLLYDGTILKGILKEGYIGLGKKRWYHIEYEHFRASHIRNIIEVK